MDKQQNQGHFNLRGNGRSGRRKEKGKASEEEVRGCVGGTGGKRMGHGKAVRGKKRWGGEREETAQGANGGKGTVRKISCGESWGWDNRARDAARRGGTGRNGSVGCRGGNGRWGEVRGGSDQERQAAVLRRRGNRDARDRARRAWRWKRQGG